MSWVHSGFVLGVDGFVRGRLVHWGALWGSQGVDGGGLSVVAGFIGVLTGVHSRARVDGFIRECTGDRWVHWCAPCGSLSSYAAPGFSEVRLSGSSFAVVDGYIGVHPRCRRGLLGSLLRSFVHRCCWVHCVHSSAPSGVF